jgi:hypothetical protein
MGCVIVFLGGVLAVAIAVLGACFGLATGILLRPALELVRMARGRPRIPYSGGWVGLFAGTSVLLGTLGGVLGAIGGIALFIDGQGGSASGLPTLNGYPIGEGVWRLSWRAVVSGVGILVGAMLVRCGALALGIVRAKRVESETEAREGESM